MGTGSFPGVKAAGREADHTPPSSAEVKKDLNYSSIHPMGPPAPVMGFPSNYVPYILYILTGTSEYFPAVNLLCSDIT
jgi:hypothetical protein